MAAVEARLQLLAVQVSADEDHLGLLALVRGPWLLGGRELDLVVHALEDKLRVALARERDDTLGAVEVRVRARARAEVRARVRARAEVRVRVRVRVRVGV